MKFLMLCFTASILSVGVVGGWLLQRDTTTKREAFNWKAEDFFDDPKVVELCQAIEAKDIDEIDKLIAQGVDVNSKGAGNMTPLLWSMPVPVSNETKVFAHLLKSGADPNVKFATDLGTRQRLRIGDSVMSHAARSRHVETLKLALENGGDPEIIDGWGRNPLQNVIETSGTDYQDRIDLLLKHGADINGRGTNQGTLPMYAVGWGGQYQVALYLLKKWSVSRRISAKIKSAINSHGSGSRRANTMDTEG